MEEVTEVPFGVPCKTRIWFSRRVQEEVARFRKKGDPNGAFWKRLKRHAENGLWTAEHGSPPPVQAEWDGVYRLGYVDTLFRIIGFYEDASKSDFIAIDAYLKKGRKLNDPQRERINYVAAVKKERRWKKVNHVQYPRLAEGSE
jgi:hypothetical protein